MPIYTFWPYELCTLYACSFILSGYTYGARSYGRCNYLSTQASTAAAYVGEPSLFVLGFRRAQSSFHFSFCVPKRKWTPHRGHQVKCLPSPLPMQKRHLPGENEYVLEDATLNAHPPQISWQVKKSEKQLPLGI